MANFIVNSINTVAVRKGEILALEIKELTEAQAPPLPPNISYVLSMRAINPGHFFGLLFETDSTLEGIQAKAATILAELEA